MSLSTSELVPSDYDDVFAFWQRQEGTGLNDCDTRQGIAGYLIRNPGLSLVARDGGKVIAGVLCGHDGRRAYLHHLAVAPSHRKQGVGKMLVEMCLQRLAAQGIRKCNIFVFGGNSSAQGFWQAIGFKTRGDLRLMQRETIPGA
jgi:N-acetylglutamate synthase